MQNTLLLLEYAFCIALIFSIIGFIRTVWFISIGYTLSIVAMCILTALFYSKYIEMYNGIQLSLLGIWGTRLGTFLIKRELNSNYTQAVKEQTDSSQDQPIGTKIMIWVGVSLLYAMMFSPAIFSLQTSAHFGDLYVWIAYLGVLVMATGLGIESIADRQKSNFKNAHPRRYCDVGLYRWVRCPNYLGEIMVWTGNFIVALAFLQVWWQWLLAFIGWACIVLIMMGSTKRLEKKQKERYGTDSQFRKYIETIPILFPWVPVFSLEKVKVYLE